MRQPRRERPAIHFFARAAELRDEEWFTAVPCKECGASARALCSNVYFYEKIADRERGYDGPRGTAHASRLWFLYRARDAGRHFAVSELTAYGAGELDDAELADVASRYRKCTPFREAVAAGLLP